MVVGSLMPQLVHHNPHIHDELRSGRHAHTATAHGVAHEGIGPIHHHEPEHKR